MQRLEVAIPVDEAPGDDPVLGAVSVEGLIWSKKRRRSWHCDPAPPAMIRSWAIRPVWPSPRGAEAGLPICGDDPARVGPAEVWPPRPIRGAGGEVGLAVTWSAPRLRRIWPVGCGCLGPAEVEQVAHPRYSHVGPSGAEEIPACSR